MIPFNCIRNFRVTYLALGLSARPTRMDAAVFCGPFAGYTLVETFKWASKKQVRKPRVEDSVSWKGWAIELITQLPES